MTQPDPTFDCLFNTISGFLLPFFLVGAGGDHQAARAAIAHLIRAYNASTTTELDLVGRIIGFGTVAMDNLRLSMTEGLSDTKVLQYRSNAVSLTRAAEQARQILQALHEQRENTRNIPRPIVVAASPAVVPPPPVAQPKPPSAPTQVSTPRANAIQPPLDIEAMKHDARMMMSAFSKHGANSGSAIHMTPEPAEAVRAAVRAAVTAASQHTASVVAPRQPHAVPTGQPRTG